MDSQTPIEEVLGAVIMILGTIAYLAEDQTLAFLSMLCTGVAFGILLARAYRRG